MTHQNVRLGRMIEVPASGAEVTWRLGAAELAGAYALEVRSMPIRRTSAVVLNTVVQVRKVWHAARVQRNADVRPVYVNASPVGFLVPVLSDEIDIALSAVSLNGYPAVNADDLVYVGVHKVAALWPSRDATLVLARCECDTNVLSNEANPVTPGAKRVRWVIGPNAAGRFSLPEGIFFQWWLDDAQTNFVGAHVVFSKNAAGEVLIYLPEVEVPSNAAMLVIGVDAGAVLAVDFSLAPEFIIEP